MFGTVAVLVEHIKGGSTAVVALFLNYLHTRLKGRVAMKTRKWKKVTTLSRLF